jgi:hypothetical protein
MAELNSPPAPQAESVPTETFRGFFRQTWGRAARAILEWIAHCLIVSALLGGMRSVQLWTKFLWQGEEVSFMGLVSLDELFHTADFILLAAVLLLGIGCVVRAYKGEP